MVSSFIQVRGLSDTSKYLKKTVKDIINASEEGVKEATMFLLGEIKQSIAGRRAEPTSVDTGRFLNSIGFKVEGLSGEVHDGVEYGKYLEYGTTKITPRSHFRNSLERSRGKIKDFVEAKIKQAV